jgi:ubiquinone/menaquinone biosynthesis C-methylase UbiE
MFKFLRRTTLDPLSVTMVGVKLADRVLVIGCGDPRFIAALAIKAGLTGRTCAVDRSEALVREAERVTLAEGALVELAVANGPTLPYDAGAFDVVVLRDVMRQADAGERQHLGAESGRVLRPGGRCMVIDGQGAHRMFERRHAPNPEAVRDLTAALISAGFVAVRELAERERLLLLEAVKRA